MGRGRELDLAAQAAAPYPGLPNHALPGGPRRPRRGCPKWNQNVIRAGAHARAPNLLAPTIRRMSCKLPHLQRDRAPHFVTLATADRWTLPQSARSMVLDSCRHDHGRTMELHIAVVMPDHVHLILTPAINYDRQRVWTLAEILWAIKSASAHRINKALNRSGKVWQDEYFDHILRSSESLNAKVDYVSQNPVRAGLVSTAEEYPWSWSLPRARAPAAAACRVA